MNENEINNIKNLLDSKLYKNILNKIGINRVPREFQTSFTQFFHDLLYLFGGLRCCYLIDYPVPEWNQLLNIVQKLNSIVPSVVKEIVLIYLNDDLWFIASKTTLKSKLKKDLSDQFSCHLFIDVSPNLKEPKVCKSTIDYHYKTLSIVAEFILSKLESSGCVEINLSKDVQCKNLLDNTYLPILSGWLCEYPIIYCNSSCHGNCKDSDGKNSDNEKYWQNNCLGYGCQLNRVQVNFNKLLFTDFNGGGVVFDDYNESDEKATTKTKSKLICSFTYPNMAESECKEKVSNWMNLIEQRWKSIPYSIWETIKFNDSELSQSSNISIRL
eukprot:gene8011-9856_t